MLTDVLNIIKDNFYFGWFAMLLFFIGFCSSLMVDFFDIKIFKAFPQWFIKLISVIISPRASFIRIFLFIFLFNSISIGLYLSSGIFVLPPFLIAFLTGMNIGMTFFVPQPQAMKGIEPTKDTRPSSMLKIMLFSTLVLILEVIAFSLALGMGMSLAISVQSNYTFIYIINLLMLKLRSYLIVCIPILFLSAYLEATVIKGSGYTKGG